ncbi:inositol monophosphatase family protein [Chlamydia caviae]|uniref:3'(2'),5'-biphosphate phosphatase nucleotidase n=1 Tax=Chlamydia caviae (strain ATCC VR-813 / DSM 19441 / 03DC25 / GPIC) TaxID=227941 RepID=Q821T6_CHLCV|nr:inositol monophosphatase family protein [Chlamydia caviae]AAP05590.1 3'(2'),5'-biphosphate phosphatase nucleotidase [Chlamydia caviae GPIC]
MPSHLLDYQRVAESIVEKTIAELIRYRQRLPLVHFWTKPDGSFVTPADYAVQYCLQKKLSTTFPHIPFIGEEVLDPVNDNHKINKILEFVHKLDPQVTPEDLLETLTPYQETSSLYWLVDPIDGTSGFIKNRFFATAVSLIYEDKPILAVMACPSTDPHTYKIYSAAKNHGVSLFGTAIESRRYLRSGTTLTGRFCEASLAARNQQHHTTRLLSLSLPGQPQACRVDSQYKYAMVAEGAVDFFIRYPFAISQAKTWDHAPGAFLVEESGGSVSDIFGNPLNYRREGFILENHPIILASGNEEIHRITLEALQERCNVVPEENLLAY